MAGHICAEGTEGFLLSLVPVFVAGARPLAPDEEQEFARIVRAALAARPWSVRLQVAVFLAVLRWWAFLRHGRRLERLAPAIQDALLRGVQDSRLQALRAGLWGVRTLVFMGYYGRDGCREEVSYRRDWEGNRRLTGHG